MPDENTSLSDEDFLARVIELYKLVYRDDIIFLIDRSNIIRHVGTKMEAVVNYPLERIIGKHMTEAFPLPEENVPDLYKSLELVIKTKMTQEFLSINLNHNDEYIVLRCVEKPIINPASGNVVAIAGESFPLGVQAYLYQLMDFLHDNSLKHTSFEARHKDKLLTLREQEIAFLLFYCKTAKKIAIILSHFYNKPVSAKTIGNIISGSLYPKLGAYGPEQLTDKLHAQGYHKKIPVSFMLNMHLDLN